MVTVNIDEKLWKEFMKQSIDLGKSASGRISDYMKKELKKGDTKSQQQEQGAT